MTPPRLSLVEAQRMVARQVRPLPAETVTLESADGRVLASDVACDRDYPPFDQALMDGYAVRSADFVKGVARLEVVGEVAAGEAPGVTVGAGQAVPISTGAVLPEGADAVVPVECGGLCEQGRVVELRDDPQPGRYIARRAQGAVAGASVLTAGTRLGPAQMAALAAAGATAVRVHRRPSVGVLTTGSELVSPEAKPRVGQMRNSNSYYLRSAIGRLGLEAEFWGIIADEKAALRAALERGLRADVLVTTGGSSVGKYDLIPELLGELGVSVCFRKVAIKPGKTTLFGTHGKGKLVFALAGNPSSCLVGWHLLAGPAVRGLQGTALRFPVSVAARSEQALAAAGDRQVFLPARAEVTKAGQAVVRPVRWSGSGDLFGLARANALIVQPAGSPAVAAGECVSVIELEPFPGLLW